MADYKEESDMLIGKIIIVSALALSVFFGLGSAPAAKAEVTVTVSLWCVYENDMVECDVYRPHGIKSIWVTVDSGIGAVTVFQEEYEGCPASVHISLDPIVLDESSDISVVECEEAGVGVGKPEPLPLKARIDVDVEDRRPAGFKAP
jgi:hypothetical protein